MIPKAKRRAGFTLIELLIIIAIIAVLAAIAAPNVIEAKARSGVSRAKAAMRATSTAIEAYAIDHVLYPIPDDENGERAIVYLGAPEGFETRVPTRLTTPVAYITSRFDEPFPAVAGARSPQLHFTSRQYFLLTEGEPNEFDHYVEAVLAPSESRRVAYYLASNGPDLDRDGPTGGATLYDPTNGALSSGDIVYFRKAPGSGK